MARTRTALTQASNSITPAFLYCRVKREEERCLCQVVQAVPQGLSDTEQHVPTQGGDFVFEKVYPLRGQKGLVGLSEPIKAHIDMFAFIQIIQPTVAGYSTKFQNVINGNLAIHFHLISCSKTFLDSLTPAALMQ